MPSARRKQLLIVLLPVKSNNLTLFFRGWKISSLHEKYLHYVQIDCTCEVGIAICYCEHCTNHFVFRKLCIYSNQAVFICKLIKKTLEKMGEIFEKMDVYKSLAQPGKTETYFKFFIFVLQQTKKCKHNKMQKWVVVDLSVYITLKLKDIPDLSVNITLELKKHLQSTRTE